MPNDSFGDRAQLEEVLTQGSLELEGRLLSASNASFVGDAVADGVSVRCIYKPVAGERPLWDFMAGTLANRERAAYLVSEGGGWGIVPPTLLRDGRFGPGMCQAWVDIDEDVELIGVIGMDDDLGDWIAVLQAEDQRGRPVLLVHKDHGALRSMAVLDAVINNADRKGGHILVDAAGALFGCDHGVSFHEQNKLRTVLWGWADEPLRAEDQQCLERLESGLAGPLGAELKTLLAGAEVEALRSRTRELRNRNRMPLPDGSWPAIPWPAI